MMVFSSSGEPQEILWDWVPGLWVQRPVCLRRTRGCKVILILTPDQQSNPTKSSNKVIQHCAKVCVEDVRAAAHVLQDAPERDRVKRAQHHSLPLHTNSLIRYFFQVNLWSRWLFSPQTLASLERQTLQTFKGRARTSRPGLSFRWNRFWPFLCQHLLKKAF